VTGKRGLTLEQRFWSKVLIQTEDECWPWIASKDSRGYGMFSMPRGSTKMIRANRFVLMTKEGFDIPLERVSRHLCNNTSCCNPKHIEGGTQNDNVEDYRIIGGHKTNAMKIAKIKSIDEVERMKVLRSQGLQLSEIAAQFGIHPSHCSRLVRGHRNYRFEG
jgi:hypothetical protein